MDNQRSFLKSVLICTVLLLIPFRLEAQQLKIVVPERPPPSVTRLQGHALLLGANSVLGGVTAGVIQMIRGGTFHDGFSVGAIGGVATYAGKTLAGVEVQGAGLVGRSLAAAGGSVTNNVASGRLPLERLIFPLGPIRLHLRPTHERWLSASVDLPGLLSLGWVMLSHDAVEWDFKQSLLQGTLVGQVNDSEWRWSQFGQNWAGTILVHDRLSEPWSDDIRRTTIAHEMVHTVQYDQFYLLWGEPLDRRLLRGNGRSSIWNHLDLGLHSIALIAANHAISYRSRPWEFEAWFISPLE